MNELQHILSSTRQAVDAYSMIDEGDRIAVGLSGGKDSTALLFALERLSRFYPKKFTVCALTVDMGFNGSDDLWQPLVRLCDNLKIVYRVEKTEIAEIVFNRRQEKNPCSLCAKLRRGALTNAAVEMGANKLALGHHLDDAAETFMMTLLDEGRIGCYSPVTLYEDSGICVIRPFIYTREAEIKSLVRAENLPVITSPCPEDGKTEREDIKSLLNSLGMTRRSLKKRIITAMETKGIDGWHKPYKNTD